MDDLSVDCVITVDDSVDFQLHMADRQVNQEIDEPEIRVEGSSGNYSVSFADSKQGGEVVTGTYMVTSSDSHQQAIQLEEDTDMELVNMVVNQEKIATGFIVDKIEELFS